jgi:hypothetical protein
MLYQYQGKKKRREYSLPDNTGKQDLLFVILDVFSALHPFPQVFRINPVFSSQT